jgi:hypothetical protein
MRINSLLSVPIFVLALTSCGPNLEDAQKLGFKSVEEMKDFQSHGFKSKQEFFDLKDSERLGFPNVQLWLQAKSEGFKDYAEYKLFLRQAEIEIEFNTFEQEYDIANDRHNYLAVKAITDKFNLYIKELFKVPLQARKWTCKVTTIYSEKNVFCRSGKFLYDLRSDRISPQLAQQLSAGQIIKFSGAIVKETSWTTVGAIWLPEFQVLNAEVFIPKNIIVQGVK